MHELGIAHEVLDIVTESSGGARVRRIVLEVGRLTAVMPEALQFCFEVASRETVAEGAELQILEPRARARCRACGSEALLESAWDGCRCGSMDLEWLSGSELRVCEMEMA